ncbi:MAG: hypothetical protein ACFFDI_31140 [Promethearchaeota archaeon]
MRQGNNTSSEVRKLREGVAEKSETWRHSLSGILIHVGRGGRQMFSTG